MRRDLGRVGRGVFPPAQVAEVKALACELPAEQGVPLSRWSSAELAREAVKRGIVATIAAITIWRWLREDAIRPWNYRSWIFPRDPRFAEKAGRILDLYEGRWEGQLLEPGDFGVKLLEHAFLAVLDFVLRTAGAQSLGQIVPVFEEAIVEHHQDPADVARAALDEVERAGGRVQILGRRTVAFAVEELHGDERVEEIGDRARVQAELRAQFFSGHAAVAELGEDTELHGGQQYLGIPESEGGLKNRAVIRLGLRGVGHKASFPWSRRQGGAFYHPCQKGKRRKSGHAARGRTAPRSGNAVAAWPKAL